MVESCFDGAEAVGGWDIVTRFRNSAGDGNEEAEPVLQVAEFGFANEPIPIQVRVRDREPGESFHDAHFEVVCRDGSEQDAGGVLFRATGTRESGASEACHSGRERGAVAREVSVEWQGRRAETVELCEARQKARRNRSTTLLDQREVCLRDA
jgi:hypothetical protein